jgi:hypothetical protein
VTEQTFGRTFEDLVETIRAIAQLFETDKVFIIGSQSILLSWPDAPVSIVNAALSQSSPFSPECKARSIGLPPHLFGIVDRP